MNKGLIMLIVEALVFIFMTGFVVFKMEGSKALSELILTAESIFNTPKTGELKKEYVKRQAEKLPATVRIFINENTIENAVQKLQEKFKEIKEKKLKN